MSPSIYSDQKGYQSYPPCATDTRAVFLNTTSDRQLTLTKTFLLDT